MEGTEQVVTKPKNKGGRPRKIKEEKVRTSADGQSVEFPDNAKIESLGPVQVPTFSSAQFDPFGKFKTEPNKYHYRGLNTKEINLSRKQAAGYEVVTDPEKGGSVKFGDLVLGRIDKGLYEARMKKSDDKARSMARSVKKKTESELQEAGFKTFEVEQEKRRKE
jgi:hypothetical protein